jgi:protocatechuate 3,4-dioxygenase beta subunit
MNRKLIGGAAALVAVAFAVWFFGLRSKEGASDERAGSGARSGKLEGAPAAPTPAADGRDGRLPREMAPRWSLDPDREGTLALEGQVVGPDGKAVAGAEVWLSSVPPRTTKSEDDGTFSFDKLVGRTYQVSAKHGTLIGGPVPYKLTGKSDPIRIQLAEGAAVVVTVVDEAQAPITGAEVRGGDLAERGAVTTDAKGEARLAPVHPGYVAVSASAAGHAAGAGFTTIGSGGAVGRLTITLRKGFPVSGHVVDEAGKPIGKAKVAVAGRMWWGDQDSDEGGAKATLTDEQGQFTMPAVAAGTHKLLAIDSAHAPATSAPFPVTDHAVTGVTITMKTGGVLGGRVVDPAGKPVPYATVRVAGSGRQLWRIAARQTTCDADGAFELRGLAREKLKVRAESDQAASQLVDADLTAQEARRDLSLVLDVAGVIAGKVVDDKGAPVAEIAVHARPERSGGESWEGLAIAGMSSAMTDGAGAFTIPGLPDGSYRLSATRSGRRGFSWTEEGTLAKPGDRDVLIKLPSPGVLKGTIAIEGAAAPPKYALVQLGLAAATPAQGGVFELRDVAPGAHDVTFRGAEFAELVRRDVKIEPGKTTDLGTVTVFRGRRLTGKVVDAKGQPVAGAQVKLGEMLFSVEGQEDSMSGLEDMSGIRSTVSDQDGSFAIIGVPPKATSVAAEHANHGRSLPVPVAEGAQDPPPLTLALRGFGSISGKVTRKGAPQSGVGIMESSKGAGARMAMAQTDEAGRFTLTKVSEGEHVLQAMQQGGIGSMRSTSVTVQVTAGKDTAVTIDIPVGELALTVQPKALPGHTVNSAQVFLFTGAVSPTTGKQVFEQFSQGGAQGMKIWFGEGKPLPEFAELLPGDYSICTIPITGNLMDPTFAGRLQKDGALLKVYCKQAKLAAQPLKQTLVHEVPSMTPLPEH